MNVELFVQLLVNSTDIWLSFMVTWLAMRQTLDWFNANYVDKTITYDKTKKWRRKRDTGKYVKASKM